MKTLFMKITGYDEPSNSLLVSFASDETKSQNPEDYPSVAFQPATMWPDVTDAQEVKKRIAVAGMYTAEQQKLKEDIARNPERITALQSLVGQASSYTTSDLTPIPSNEVVL